MKKTFNYLVIFFLVFYSCKSIEIENKKSYKKINKNNISISKPLCSNDIYTNKQTKN